MRFPSMFLAILFVPLSLSAQTGTGNAASTQMPADQASTGPVIIHLGKQMAALELRYQSACPVGFSVAGRPDGSVVWTDNAPAPVSHGPGLNIVFGKATAIAPSQAPIVSASITVHGMSRGTRLVPLQFGDTPDRSIPANDATETFSLGGKGSQPLLNPSIWTKNMAAVTSVELTQVTYADGTTWQPSAAHSCSARPSLYVPVSAGR